MGVEELRRDLGLTGIEALRRDLEMDAPPDAKPKKGALANLKTLPKFITEGLPAAGKAAWQRATDPTETMGHELARAAPWLPIVPAVQDIISRAGRVLSAPGAAVAELGPERAKPLTEALANVAMGGRGARRAFAGAPAAESSAPAAAPSLPRPPRTEPPAAPPAPSPARPAPPPASPAPPATLSGPEQVRAILAPVAPPGTRMPPIAPVSPPSGRPSAPLDIFGLEMDKSKGPLPPPAPAVTPTPEIALRDYMAPGGTKVHQQIGDEVVEWTKTGRNEWQGWVAGAHRKLTGESALNLAANPPAKVVGAGAPAPQPSVAVVQRPVAPPVETIGQKTDLTPEYLERRAAMLPPKPPDVGPVAPPPRFEATPEGMQGVIGDIPKRAMPTGPSKARVPQADVPNDPLFNPERAARSDALEGAQTRLEMGGTQQAAVNEWLMQEIGGTYGIALTRAKSPGSIQPAVAAKLKSLGIDPADAWHATHAEVPPPGVLDRLAAKSAGTPALEAPKVPRPDVAPGPPPNPTPGRIRHIESRLRDDINADQRALLEDELGALKTGRPLGRFDDVLPPKPPDVARKVAVPPKVKKSNPNAFQAKGDWETGVPNLTDPDDVFTVIQGAGKIKVGDDLAGELRQVPNLFKSKNGRALDQIAEGLVESYPHLGGGDRAAVKEQLLDTMARYVSLRRDKATKKAKEKASYDVQTSVTGKQVKGPLAPEDTVLKTELDWWGKLMLLLGTGLGAPQLGSRTAEGR